MSELEPRTDQEIIERAHQLRGSYTTYHNMGKHALNWLDSEYRFNKADARAREAGKLVSEHQDIVEASALRVMEADLSNRKAA